MKRSLVGTVVAVVFTAMFPSLAAYAGDNSSSSNVDDLLIAAQKTCPITGNELGSMGKPLKTIVNDQTVFLCCKGCVGKTPSKDKWNKLTENLRAAQAECPVDHKALLDDASSVVVKHRMVFVDSAACSDEVKAHPDKYIAIVNDLLTENLEKSKHKN